MCFTMMNVFFVCVFCPILMFAESFSIIKLPEPSEEKSSVTEDTEEVICCLCIVGYVKKNICYCGGLF